MKNPAILALLLLSVSPSARAQTLDLAALGAPLENLQPGEKQILDEAIQLIQRGEHGLALASLGQLTASNPKNSAYRVLQAYTLLQLGNLVGALNESRAAESSKPPSPYRCCFLAQVAYLAGNKALCEREIRHVAAHPVYGPQAAKLRQDLKAQRC
jgi:Flp pilus assembly protein TadD